ncbi:hypothetical protein NIES2111_58590 (plasmid) [Nostoc sp. NIES-2111]|nr:hypothetical protein NIES2111_58590 [Nostoc sp. NIES-2111]
MLKPSLALTILSTVLAVNAVSPALALPQKTVPNAIQLNGVSGLTNYEPDDWCGTRIPGIPPRPHFPSQILVRNTNIVATGPKQDDPASIARIYSRLSSTGVGNPGIVNTTNLQTLSTNSCANLR